jgi:glycine cleavage system transcriptional repressor
MTLIVAVDADAETVRAALTPLTADGSLVARVEPVEEEPDPVSPPAVLPYVLSVHGADRRGLVAAVTRALADVDGNVTDLTTRLGGGLYVLTVEVDLPAATDVAALATRLRTLGADLGVEVWLRPVDTDVL